MNCCMCQKELEETDENHTHNQPHGGGEIKLSFTFGSVKFDNSAGMTYFDGYICDDCANKLVPFLKENNTFL